MSNKNPIKVNDSIQEHEETITVSLHFTNDLDEQTKFNLLAYLIRAEKRSLIASLKDACPKAIDTINHTIFTEEGEL